MTYPSQPNPGYGGAPRPQWQHGAINPPGPNYGLPSGYQQPFYQGPGRPPRKPRTGVVFGIALALVLLVGAATGAYFGAIKKHDTTITAASTPFGDLDTLDPCGLVNSDAFSDSNADAHIQPISLGVCEVTLYLHDIKGGYTIDVALEHQAVDPKEVNDPAVYSVNAAGPLHVAKEVQEAGRDSDCVRAVYQDDYEGVRVFSDATGDTIDSSGAYRAGYGACNPADEAATAIVAAVSSHSLARIDYPKDSLGTVNFCSMINDNDVDTALKTSTLHMLQSRLNTRCPFAQNGPSVPPRIRVEADLYTVATWNNGYPTSLSTVITFAGRLTSIYSDPNSVATGHKSDMCEAQTPVKTWSAWPGRIVFGGPIARARASDYNTLMSNPATLIEVASVEVTLLPGDPSDCTTAAKALAAKIWPLLPPATP